MNFENQFNHIQSAFMTQKIKAEAFIERYNSALPTERCPGCDTADHCPGLPCPDCNYVYQTSWSILKDTEWGYDVVALNDRKRILVRFNVEL